MYKKVSVSSLRPNPYRNMPEYKIDRGKVEQLKRSFEATDFWENIVARPNGHGYEIAYGHHRLVALQETLGPKQKVGVLVKPIDDATMIRMMAEENLEHWSNSFLADVEVIDQLVKGYANGDFKLPHRPERSPKDVRYAPSFFKGGDPIAIDNKREQRAFPYTATSIGEFLGWEKTKVRDLLIALEAIELGYVKRDDLRGLKKETCIEIVRGAMRTARAIVAKNVDRSGKTKKERQRAVARVARSSITIRLARDTVRKARESALFSKQAAAGAARRTAMREARNILGPTMDIKAGVEYIARRVENFLSTGEIAARLEEIENNRKYLEPVSSERMAVALESLVKRAKALIRKFRI